MTVQELMEELKYLDPNMEVRFTVPTGDYWRHVKAKSIATVEQTEIEFSEYLDEYQTTDGEVDPDNSMTVVLLSC